MKRIPKPAYLLIVPFVLLVGAAGLRRCRGVVAPPPVGQERTLVHGGLARQYLLFSPASARGPRPLVVVMHGGGGNAREVQATTGFIELARREGLFVVFPFGTGRWRDRLLTFNAGRCCGWAKNQGVDDAGFIAQVVKNLVRELPVDPRRVYATGLSNGGMMSYRLACEHSDLFAAIAPVAGSLALDGCAPWRGVSVIAFHGTADEHVLWQGGVGQKGLAKDVRLSQAQSLAPFLKVNGCAAQPVETRQGNIVRRVYPGCRQGAVEHVSIVGGKHAWPGGKTGWIGGDVPTQEINANEAMWAFFKNHPKP